MRRNARVADTAVTMLPAVRSEGLLHPATSMGVGLLSVGVRVLDARTNYGRMQLLVRPLVGAGLAWVDAQRVDMSWRPGPADSEDRPPEELRGPVDAM